MSTLIHKKLSSTLLGLCAATLMATSAYADVTGTETLRHLLSALSMPRSCSNNADEAILNDGRRLGILSDSDSWVEGPISKNMALNLAFRTLGLDIELDVAAWISNDMSLDPTRANAVSALASSIKPAVPQNLLNDDDQLITENELSSLISWAQQAQHSLLWDVTVQEPDGLLRVYRSGAGMPPKGWQISMGSFSSSSQAQSVAQQLSSKTGVSFNAEADDTQWLVLSAPYNDAAQAKSLAKAIDGATVIPQRGAQSQALFWIAWSPEKGHEGWVLSSRFFNKNYQPLSTFSSASGATVAINGGYFGGGKPIGTLFLNGNPMYMPYTGRSMIGWNAEKSYFGSPDFRVMISAGNENLGVARSINTPPPPGELGFYALPLGLAPQNGPNGQVVISDGQNVVPGPHTPAGGFAVQSKGPYIPEEGPLQAQIQWGDNEADGVQWAFQGGPMLIKDGQFVTANEGVATGVSNRRHPRTAVGRTSDGRLWWVVIDGRNSWHSRGMTFDDMKKWGMDNGFVDLLNLDGGGSSEFIYHGKIMNNPSDGRERNLPYGVLFGGQMPSSNAGGQDLDDPISNLLRSIQN